MMLRSWSAGQDYWTLIDDMTDAELVEIGELTCQALDAGATVEDLYFTAVDTWGDDETTLDNAARIMGAAVNVLCPEHINELEDGA